MRCRRTSILVIKSIAGLESMGFGASTSTASPKTLLPSTFMPTKRSMQGLGGRIVFLMHYKLRTLVLRDVRSEEPLVSLSCKSRGRFGIAYPNSNNLNASLVPGTYSAHFTKNFVSCPSSRSYPHTLRSQIP